ncbi:MAG: 40-residue beta-propeller repeat containing protein [Candidatus Angelobacter sp.]|nr:40-residue beta-propeller repeat containing protein [Candidatus Angelobacter sp.]
MRVRYAAGFMAIVLSVFFEAGCGDTFRPIALPIVQPGGQPQAQANAVIISNAGPAVDGTTTHIDTTGDSNVGQVTVGRSPIHATFVSSNQFTVVANSGSDNINFYPTFGAINANPAGSVTLTAGAKPSFVFSNVPNTIFVAEPGLSAVGVVTLSGTPTLVTDIPVGSNPVGLVGTSDGQRLYVANQADGTVTVIAPSSNSVVPSVSGQPNPVVVGSSPVFLAVSKDNTKVFAVNRGNDSVSVINTNTNGVTNVNVGASPNFAFFDTANNLLWVTNSGADTVTVINVLDFTDVRTISLVGTGAAASCASPAKPVSITVLADGTRAYVADSGCNSVSVISTLSKTVTKTIPVGTTPVSIDSTTDSTKVVVVNKGSNTASVIQTSDDTVAVNVPVPASPVFVAITH